MNTARFLFCVNSDDPDIVAQGLEEFRSQVLKDHGATESYGYHGRGSYENFFENFHPERVLGTVGVLASFIRSSPLLEELFILWGLPGRDDDKPLSSSHMACIAVILHVAVSNVPFCSTIVNRILHEHAKSIVAQLSCGNIKLVHSTLALVLAMCRTSPQNCRDTFQKLVPISVSTFATLLQQGKTVSWESAKTGGSEESPKLKTDSRLLLIIIILTAIESADQSTGPELFSSATSLLKRITNAISKDTSFTIQFILESLMYLRKQPLCEQQIGSKLVDLRFQDNLMSLYYNDDSKVLRCVHTFLLDHAHHLVSSMSKGGRSAAAGNSKASALQLLRNLECHRDLNHREIQMVLLKAQPSLLAKSISSVALTSWEPVATVQYYCALSQLTFLCGSVDVDSQFKASMKLLVASVTGDGSERDSVKAEATIRGLTSSFVQAMIPSSFQKKDISKLLQHKNPLLQRSGLLYVLAVMQRLLKALSAAAAAGAGRAVKIEGAVAAAVHKLLPDFQLLLNIRSKYSKVVAEIDPEEAAMETEATDDRQKTLYLLSLLLRVIECYIKSVPSLVSQAGFELTRLIDEVVPWSGKDSAATAISSINVRIGTISTVLGPVIRALRHATSSRQCKWFGSIDDCGKLITHLVVMPEWDSAVKRTPLAKLLLLAACAGLEEADKELYLSVRQLVRAVLKQSEMYQGHGVVDLELRAEQAAWLGALSSKDNSILMLDATLRIAYHWNTEYCIEASDRVNEHTHGTGYQPDEQITTSNDSISIAVPFSPVMSCAINLCSNDFNILSGYLPKHIRVHIDPQKDLLSPSSPAGTIEAPLEVITNPSILLSKYSTGFRSELQKLLLSVVITCGLKARSSGSYGKCVLAVADGKNVLSDSESTILDEITDMSALLSASNLNTDNKSNNSHKSDSIHNSIKSGKSVGSGVGKVQVSTDEFQLLLKNIALNDDDSSVTLLRSVLAKVEGTSSNGAKRARVEASPITEDCTEHQLNLNSAVIGYTVQNMDRIVTCCSTIILNNSDADHASRLFLGLIESIWFFSASLHCNHGTVQGQPGASFCQWVAMLATRELNRSRQSGELEHKATVVVQVIRLLRLLSAKYNPVPVSSTAKKEVVGIRRGRSAWTDESNTNLNTAVHEAVCALTSLAVELIRQTSCAQLIADALTSTELLDGMMQKDLYGNKIRQILCAAASAYYRRFNARTKKGADHLSGVEDTLSLWKVVAERLLTMQASVKSDLTNLTSQTALSARKMHSATHTLQEYSENDTFSLGWMIQHFVDNQLLRSQFIDLALRDGQGHSLLDFNFELNTAVSSSFALIPLDAVSVSVLQSASVETLAGALKSFIDLKVKSVNVESVNLSCDSTEITDTASAVVKSVTGNALCCVTIGLGSSASSPYPHISSFISPLSLMQLGLKTTETAIIDSKLYQTNPLCPTLFRDFKASELLSVALPLCVGRGDLTLMETVRLFREFEVEKGAKGTRGANEIVCATRRAVLLAIGERNVRVVASVCKLLSHSLVVESPYSLCLLASYVQSQATPAAMARFLRGSFSAIAICSSLPEVLKVNAEKEVKTKEEEETERGEGGEEDVLAFWCDSFHGFICDLLDEFAAYLAALESLGTITPEISSQITSYFALLQPLIMISMTAAYNGEPKVDKIIDILRTKSSEIRKKLNKWIKSCLKFGLHSLAVVNGLQDFYSATRGYFLGTFEKGSLSLWGLLYAPKVADSYHPFLILQMVVSHSKFSVTLRGGKVPIPNISLLKFLLVLLSISLPLSENKENNENKGDNLILLSESKNNPGTVADQFLVSVLLTMYQGTMSDSDRLIIRILYLLNNAEKCPALCTLKPITLNSKKSQNITQSSGPIFGSILQQLVYTTLSSYPAWRTTVPQPLLSEGAEAEKLYRQQFSSLIHDVTQDWGGEEVQNDNDNNGMGDNDENDLDSSDGSGSDDSDAEGEGEGDDQSDMNSILSIVSDKNNSAEWCCEDSDAYVPSIDILTGRTEKGTDKVYDPSFWIPALHHTLMQQSHSVRQLANTGALSLVIAGISSRCPVLRMISISSLQRILELTRQQTPDKDAGFRERPQLLLLLNFVRNALDSFAPSSSGPTQFPSVITLFLSRAALHLLQPTHELYSKINKYLLSRPFCDFKDVPLYDLLVVDGDAQTEQASRLTTFRIVRDGLCTRWDHLNLCRKNAYNRLMLLFPVLSKDTRAGHAVFDLLDKALGMQVSARYLLERCSVVSWLQQMASPTNSLDIDTTRATDITSTKTSDMIENEDDEDEAQKGKGGRNVVIRSQPSVLLAAPPRLLARVLCLLRRALGASYLLSASSSTSSALHLNEIQLAISTLIDSVVAVDSVGMASEIPVEYFRQLVLLMWDYALASANAGVGKSLAWGVDRVHLLALAIQHSSRSTDRNTGSQAVDDMVISLLSLLSFQTSGLLQGPFSHYETVRDMLAGCALKHLVLAQGDKIKGDVFAIAQSTQIRNNETHDASYHSVVSSLSQDNSKRMMAREAEVNLTLDPSGSWTRLGGTVGTDISLLIHESWEQLAQTGYEAMNLPVSMGKKVMLCMSVNGILNVAIMSCKNSTLPVQSCVSSASAPVQTPLFPIEIARWALTMKSAYLRPSMSALNLSTGGTGGSGALMRRVLSSSDRSSFNAYTTAFCDYQLCYRLTVLTVASIMDHITRAEQSRDKMVILVALRKVLYCLLRVPYNGNTPQSAMDIFQYLNSKGMNDTAVPDGSFFWEMETQSDNLSPRRLVEEICNLALEISAGFVSTVERNSAAVEVRGSPSVLEGNDGDISIFERLIVDDARHVTTLCEALNSVISQGRTSFSIAAQGEMPMKDLFETIPGREKTPLGAVGFGAGAKRSIMLFDRSSAVWRLGGEGSRDRVMASMRAVQYAPLMGVQSRHEGEGVEDGSDIDENEMDVMDTDDAFDEEGEEAEDENEYGEDFSPLRDNKAGDRGDELDWAPASDADDDDNIEVDDGAENSDDDDEEN